MGFFSSFSNNKPKAKDVAKDRLRLILIHDRGDIPADTIEKMRLDILEVISKYVEVDPSDVEIAVTKSDEMERDSQSSLVANIPMKGVIR